VPDDNTEAVETTTASDTGATGTEKGSDGQPFDAARAQRAIDAQRAEIRDLKARAREADDLKARLQAIEDKDKSETERQASRAQEALEKLTAAEQRAADLALQMAVERAARKLHFIDEDDAYRLLDRKAVELDDDGTPSNVEKLLTTLAKAKPHLIAAEAGTQTRGGTQAVPGTPKPQGRPANRAELIEQAQKELAASGKYIPL